MIGKAIDTVLGKNTTEYRQTYAPDYLVPINRQDNRDGLGILAADLPFTGFDIWHDYEASFLYNGYPVNGILKLVIPASSPKTVESKSLKLYLFSFIMQEMGKRLLGTKQDAILEYESVIRKDLSDLIGAPITVCFHEAGQQTLSCLDNPDLYMRDGMSIKNLDAQVDLATLGAPVYQETQGILTADEPTPNKELFIVTDSLKSNCKVTHQPDWGQLYIHMKGPKQPTLESLFKYIVSFRGENHFHEEIVECVFKRLLDNFQPEELDVMAFYTRRGGIDICPMRSTRDGNVFSRFADPTLASYRAVRS